MLTGRAYRGGDSRTTAPGLEAKIRRYRLESHAGEILASRRAEVRLLPAVGGVAEEDEVGLGATKIGGLPDLPGGIAWPRGSGEGGIRPPGASLPPREGRPLSFLAQVNLTEIAAVSPAAPLPDRGLLYFFYDALAQPWGFDPRDRGGFEVLYAPPVGFHGRREALFRREPPEDLDREVLFPGYGVALSPWFSLPRPGDEEVASWGLDESDGRGYEDLYYDLEAEGPSPAEQQHKVLGRPDHVQGEHMAFQCQMAASGVYVGGSGGPAPDPVRVARLAEGAKEWCLLLQLDSDRWAGMAWGDAGRLFFWTRDVAPRAREFKGAWAILQSH